MGRVIGYSPDEGLIYVYLRKYLPNFLLLLDPSPSDLRRIERTIELRYSQVDQALKKGQVFAAETTLIDLLWKIDEKDIHALRFVNFLDRACLNLRQKVPPALQPKFKNTLVQLIVNFDETSSRYRSYVGELLVLNQLMTDDRFILEDIEHRLPNGKSADYALRSRIGRVLVEVESIDMAVDKIATASDFDTFVAARTEKKLTQKLSNLPSNWADEFYLVQVVWGDILRLRAIKQCFNRRTKFERIALKLMIVAQFFDLKLQLPVYAFMTADAFLSKEDGGSALAPGDAT